MVDKRSEMQKFLDQLPDYARTYWATVAQSAELIFKDEPYFSRGRFEPTITVDGSSNATYAFTAGQKVQLFNYGIGAPLTTAGFSATGYATATAADTNLTTAAGKETNSSDMVYIMGFGVVPGSLCDPVLLKLLWEEISVSAGFGGDSNTYKLGNLGCWPGGGGLHGGSSSPLAVANLADGKAIVPGVLANGLPAAGDIRWLKDPIVWMPKPQQDSQFTMQFTIERSRSLTANARVAATGIQAITPPATVGAEGTFVDFKVYLYGAQLGPRSRNR